MMQKMIKEMLKKTIKNKEKTIEVFYKKNPTKRM